MTEQRWKESRTMDNFKEKVSASGRHVIEVMERLEAVSEDFRASDEVSLKLPYSSASNTKSSAWRR